MGDAKSWKVVQFQAYQSVQHELLGEITDFLNANGIKPAEWSIVPLSDEKPSIFETAVEQVTVTLLVYM